MTIFVTKLLLSMRQESEGGKIMCKSATETLRRMLDERGVEWWEERYGDGIITYTLWESPIFGTVRAMENDDNKTLFMACLNNCDFIPKQAIAVTLGSQRYYTDRDDEGTHIMCDQCGEYIGTAEEIATTLGNNKVTEDSIDKWLRDFQLARGFSLFDSNELKNLAYALHDDIPLGYEASMRLGQWLLRAEFTSGKITSEQVRDAIFNNSTYAGYDTSGYYINGIGMDMRHIASKLNATLKNETC